MTLENLLGWTVLLSMLLGTSAALVLPGVRPLERALFPGRRHWLLRLVLVVAVAAALWTAIPLAAQYVSSYFAE